VLVKRVSEWGGLGGGEERVIGVVVGGGFEEGEGGADEFVEDGKDNGQGSFTRGAETFGKGLSGGRGASR
jgi:hypothetical protein